MLSSDEILNDLNETQSKLNSALDDNPTSTEAHLLSLKMIHIVTWLMQNGYVMP